MKRVFRLKRSHETIDSDIGAELQFHFEASVEDLMARGLDRAAAQREALRRFGDVSGYRDRIEHIERGRAAMERHRDWLDILRQDLAFALRALKRSPGFTFAVVLTLGLGIGANAVMFGVVDRLLLRPPAHIENPAQIRRLLVQGDFAGNIFTFPSVSYPDFQDFAKVESFASVAAHSFAPTMTLDRGDDAVRVNSVLTTASFFPLLGVDPAHGRFFTADEDRIGAVGTAVLSHAFWRRHFGADPGVLGRVLDLGKRSYTVVGVAPQGFTGVDLRPVDIWLPLHAAWDEVIQDGWITERGWTWLAPIARLRPGITREAAESEATTIHRVAHAESGGEPDGAVVVEPLIAARGSRASNESVVVRWLGGVSLIVLLIACANVANLLLARGMRWRRETAIRLALGVSRTRLVGQLLTESMAFAGLGGLAGLIIARWGGDLMRTALVSDVAWIESPVNTRVLVFTLIATLATGLIAGIVPALHSSGRGVTDSLKSGSGSSSTRRSRTRMVLLVTQGALSVVLLVGAGLFVRSLSGIQSLDLGMEAERLLLAQIEIDVGSAAGDDRVARVNDVFREAIQQVRSVPGVERASASRSIPFRATSSRRVAVPGRDSIPRLSTGGPYINGVTADHFVTMGMTVLHGRGFTDTDDRESAARVTVLNETMANVIWPSGNALGQCLQIGGRNAPCATVVGIVKDPSRNSLLEGKSMQYYVPWGQGIVGGRLRGLFIRTAANPESLAEAVRRQIRLLDPAIRFVEVQPLQALIDPQTRTWKLGATMFTAFGALALVVAGIGLYSVLAFSVAQRTRELGVRAALGATSDRLIVLVFREGIQLTAAGIMLGAVIVLLAGRAIAPLLYEVSPRDPAVFGIVTLVLMVIAALASALPAWHATRVDPNEALRTD